MYVSLHFAVKTAEDILTKLKLEIWLLLGDSRSRWQG